MDKDEFSTLVDQTGLTLTDEQKSVLFDGLSAVPGNGRSGYAADAARSGTCR